jgi:predicted nuclease of predicted toxin-antitoxin system
MKFKVDENLPVEVADLLRAAGHDADTVLDEGLGGAADPALATLVRREDRALLTLGVGFADIRSYPPEDYAGLVVLRLGRQDKEHVLRVCARLLQPLASQSLSRRLWIVEDDSIRVRGGEP